MKSKNEERKFKPEFIRELEETLEELVRKLKEIGVGVECTLDPEAEEDCVLVYKDYRFSLWDLAEAYLEGM